MKFLLTLRDLCCYTPLCVFIGVIVALIVGICTFVETLIDITFGSFALFTGRKQPKFTKFLGDYRSA